MIKTTVCRHNPYRLTRLLYHILPNLRSQGLCNLGGSWEAKRSITPQKHPGTGLRINTDPMVAVILTRMRPRAVWHVGFL